MNSAQVGETTLRRATPADARLLFNWVNSPDSLQGKLDTHAPITWEQHQSWYQKALIDPETTIDIIEVNSRPSGQIRGQSKSYKGRTERHIDIYVIPEVRGVGVARRAAEHWIDQQSDRPLLALVKNDNHTSFNFFKSIGFHVRGNDDVVCEMVRET